MKTLLALLARYWAWLNEPPFWKCYGCDADTKNIDIVWCPECVAQGKGHNYGGR
jgi:predicted amidophosphoribosyltransferase